MSPSAAHASQALYGRGREQRALTGALERTRLGTTELLLLTGPRGVGISALGRWLSHQAAADGLPTGCSGCVPGDPMIDRPIAQTVEQLIIDAGVRADNALIDVLSPHAEVAHRLLPSTTAWVPRPATRQRPLCDTSLVVLSSVLQHAVDAARPGVVFLDDLEEADLATADLLGGVAADPRIRGLVIVAGVQSDGQHSLVQIRKKLQLRGARWREISVRGLDASAIAEWTADRATVDMIEGLRLSRAIAQGSRGRPGAISWILDRAESGGVLSSRSPRAHAVLGTLAARAEGWQSAVSLRLEVTGVLAAASLFRTAVCTAHLATAAQMDPTTCAQAIEEAVSAGLLVQHEGEEPRFAIRRHARVASPQTAKDLAAVGRRLHHATWETADAGLRASILFLLSSGAEHLSDAERSSLANRAHAEARSAHRTGASPLAAALLDVALAALPSHPVGPHRKLALSCHHTAAEVARLLNLPELTTRHLSAASALIEDPLEALPGVLTRISHATEIRDFEGALRRAEIFLDSIDRPLVPTGPLQYGLALARIAWAMLTRRPQDEPGPPPADPLDAAVQLVRMECTPAEATLRPNEVPARVLQDVQRVLRKGSTGAGSFAWLGVAVFHVDFGWVRRGSAWAHHAGRLSARRGDQRWHRRIQIYRHLLVHPWEEGFLSSAEQIERASTPFLIRGEAGLPWIGVGTALFFRLYSGASPSSIVGRARDLLSLARSRGVTVGLEPLENALAFCSGVTDPDREPAWSLTQSPGVARSVQAFRMLLALQRGDRSRCASFVLEVHTESLLERVIPPNLVSDLYWLACLPLAVDAGTVTWSQQRRRARKIARRLHSWARRPERAYQALWAQAALAHAAGSATASAAYDQALESARLHGQLHDAVAIAASAATLETQDSARVEALLETSRMLRRAWLGPTSESSGVIGEGGDGLLQCAVAVDQETELAPMLETALTGAQHHTGYATAHVLLLDADQLSIRGEVSAHGWTWFEGGKLLTGSGLPEDWIRGAVAGDQVQQRAEGPDHTRSLGVPISRGGPVYGLLFLDDGPALAPTKMHALQVLAAQVAASLENLELVNALEQKVLERTEQLQHALARAEAANSAKSAFLARMSHELKTPLNAIIGLADHLESDARNPPRVVQRARTIHTSGTHLLGVIRDVMDMATVEAGRLELYPTRTELRAAVRACVDMVAEAARQKGLSIRATVTEEVPESVHIDASRLRQILINLLGNAIKFTSEGTVRLEARVESIEEGERLRFDVQDTGIGIPPEDLVRVFEPFEQAGDSPQRRDGAGLGLAISAHFLEEMGGRLTAVSEPGRGSLFSVLLPLEGLSPAYTAEAPEPASEPTTRFHIEVVPPIQGLPRDALEAMRSEAREGRLSRVRSLAEDVPAHLDHAPVIAAIIRYTEDLQEHALCAYLERLQPEDP